MFYSINNNKFIMLLFKYFRKITLLLFFLLFIFYNYSCELINYNYIKKQTVLYPTFDIKIVEKHINEKNLDYIIELSTIYPEIINSYKKEIISLIKYYYDYYNLSKDFFGLIKIYFNIQNLFIDNKENINTNIISLDSSEKYLLNRVVLSIKENLFNLYNNEKNYIFKYAFYKYLKNYISDLEIKLPELSDKNKIISSYSDIMDNILTVYNDKGFKIVNGVSIPDIFIGSAFFIDYNLLVTNNHVISNDGKDFNQIYVILAGNKIRCEVLYSDKDFDLAILKISYSNKKFKYFNIRENINVGDEVTACGSPYGLENTFTRGIISNTRRKVIPLINAYQTDTPMNPGNSGGPVVDKNFNLIGISFSSVYESQNLNFIIPVEYLIYSLIYSKYSYKPLRSWLGFYFNKSRITYLNKNSINYFKFKKVIGDNLNFVNFKIKQINNIEFNDEEILNNFDLIQKYIFFLPASTIVSVILIDNKGLEKNVNFLTYLRPKNVNLEIFKYDTDINLITPYLGIIIVKESKNYMIVDILDEVLKVLLGLESGDYVNRVQIYIDEKKEYIILSVELTIKSKNLRSYAYSFLIYFEQEWFI
ncbi:MAG: S1C family serine protease [Spirochaetes bacterium]|nr:S1C family serine protease [Spirochaetota bacterium]